MDYSSLKSDVADWLARGDVALKVDSFIDLAEAFLNRKLRIWPMERSYLQALDADNRASIPTGLLQVKDFFLFRYSEALPADDTEDMPLEVEKILQLEPVSPNTESGVYRRWTRDRHTQGRRSRFTLIRQGDEWLVRPTNTDLPNLGGMYYKKFDPLTDANSTNWLTDNAPDLLLRATVLEGAIYIKDQAAIQYWKALRDEALVEVGDQFAVAEYAGGRLAPFIPGAC